MTLDTRSQTYSNIPEKSHFANGRLVMTKTFRGGTAQLSCLFIITGTAAALVTMKIIISIL